MKYVTSLGNRQSIECTSPALPQPGDPIRYGDLTGICVTAEGVGSVATEAMVEFSDGIYSLDVTDVITGGMAVGAKVYLHDGSPPTLNNQAIGGYFFGFALQVVPTGQTANVMVKHAMVPTSAPDNGALILGSDGVTGSWRLFRVGDDLATQRYEGGAWVTKSTVVAS